MTAEQRVAFNPSLLVSILNNLSSHELLRHRLICKFWTREVHGLVGRRHHQFFFSPATTTKSIEGDQNLRWKQSWENVLQISFIFCPKRDAFIRAPRRLLDINPETAHLQAVSSDPEERGIESAFFQDMDDYWNGRVPSNNNFNCKMAGCTVDAFTDFLIQSFDNVHDSPSIFPLLSYRFECGRLRDRREILRFFGVMGSKIRYLTVGLSHNCGPRTDETGGEGDEDEDGEAAEETRPWYEDDVWDHRYEFFNLVPKLIVLTLTQESTWFIKNTKYHDYSIDPQLNEPRTKLELEGRGGEQNGNGGLPTPFFPLKCLRFQGPGDKSHGHFARWILLKAPSVQRIVFERGVYPSLLPSLGPVNYQSLDEKSLIVDPLTRLITPINTLCLRVLQDSPDLLGYIAQVVDLQSTRREQVGSEGGRWSFVQNLHLYMTTDSEKDAWRGNPYRAPFSPHLLRILKTVAKSLYQLILSGAAGLFLEGLLLNNLEDLQSFPHLRKLYISFKNTYSLHVGEFLWSPRVQANGPLDLDPANLTLTSATTLSKVFPRVEELNLYDPYSVYLSADFLRLAAFLPHPNILENPQSSGNPGQGHGHGLFDEVKSVKKLQLGFPFPAEAFNIWRFQSLETLFLDYESLEKIAPAIWSEARTLQTLMINRLFTRPAGLAGYLRLEELMTGLSTDDITQCNEDLERSLPTVLSRDHFEACLREKRATFTARLHGTPSILDLGQLRHLKFLLCVQRCEMKKKVFSRVSGRILFDLLPPSCHITIWARVIFEYNRDPGLLRQILEETMSSTVPSHPRVSIRTVKLNLGNDSPF